MSIVIGARYKLMNHPMQPTGKITASMPNSRQVEITWDDKNLIPSSDRYPEDMFINGGFQFLDYGDSILSGFSGYLGDYGYESVESPQEGCFHNWKIYNSGWTEYEYCEKCSLKK